MKYSTTKNYFFARTAVAACIAVPLSCGLAQQEHDAEGSALLQNL
jgi:hypothetical protein